MIKLWNEKSKKKTHCICIGQTLKEIQKLPTYIIINNRLLKINP